MEKIKQFGGKAVAKCKDWFGKVKEWFKNVNWKTVYDRFSTALLILLMCSPFLILLYIVLWFVFR